MASLFRREMLYQPSMYGIGADPSSASLDERDLPANMNPCTVRSLRAARNTETVYIPIYEQ